MVGDAVQVVSSVYSFVSLVDLLRFVRPCWARYLLEPR
jgi:hypothetical protein